MSNYLSFEPWYGGFNNVRMSLEIAYALAYMSGRTLVLPPAYRISFHDRAMRLTDFFKVSGVATCDFEPFMKKWSDLTPGDLAQSTGPPRGSTKPATKGIEKIAVVPDRDPMQTVYCFPCIPRRTRYFVDFLGGREAVKRLGVPDEVPVVHYPRTLLGPFYTMIYCSNPAPLRRAVRDGVRYHDWIFDAARTAVGKLGRYSAVHVRRNDFVRMYSDQVPNIDQIMTNIDRILEPGEKLYIATDEPDYRVFDPLARRYQLRFVSDIEGLLPGEGRSTEFLPLIEQVICAHGRTFVGTRLSTMSSYIYRLRGYLGALDTNYYVLSKTNSAKPQCYDRPSWKGLVAPGSHWTREFPEAWDYGRPPRSKSGISSWIPSVKRWLWRLRHAVAREAPVVVRSSTRVRQSPGWRLEADGRRYVLRAPAGGKDLRCNANTAVIWRLYDDAGSVQEVIDVLVEAYPDGASRIPRDVTGVVGKLVARGALMRVDSFAE